MQSMCHFNFISSAQDYFNLIKDLSIVKPLLVSGFLLVYMLLVLHYLYFKLYSIVLMTILYLTLSVCFKNQISYGFVGVAIAIHFKI